MFASWIFFLYFSHYWWRMSEWRTLMTINGKWGGDTSQFYTMTLYFSRASPGPPSATWSARFNMGAESLMTTIRDCWTRLLRFGSVKICLHQISVFTKDTIFQNAAPWITIFIISRFVNVRILCRGQISLAFDLLFFTRYIFPLI